MTLDDPPRNGHGQPDSDGHYPDAAGHWQAFQPRVPPPSATKTERQAVLDEAAAAIAGAREDTYGDPEQSFTTIAQFWTAYLDRYIEPQDVAAMMALLKLARVKYGGGRSYDSWVDLAGYAAVGAEVATDRPDA